MHRPSEATSPDQPAMTASRAADPLGDTIHTALGALYLFSLPLTTAGSSITFALLAIFTLVRLRHTVHAYRTLSASSMLWLVLIWIAWYAVSFAWSADAAQGWDELRAARVLATPWLLWPVIDRAPVLIGAAMAGVVATNMIQFGQGLELLGLAPGENGRLTGLIHPTQAGIWCVAAMCWATAGALTSRGWLRVASIVVLLSAGAGLLATGSRGPWLAGAVAAPVALILVAMRHRTARRAAVVVITAGAIACVAAGIVGRGFIERRVSTAATELADGWNEEVYWTDGGLRIGLWRWAWDGFTDAPIIGQGAGSFEVNLRANPSFLAAEEAQKEHAPRFDMERGHSHSVYLQTLSDLGIVGGVIGLALLLALLRNGWRASATTALASGSFAATIGWIIGAAFDCYHFNGHTFGLLALLIVLTLRLSSSTAVSSSDLQESPCS